MEKLQDTNEPFYINNVQQKSMLATAESENMLEAWLLDANCSSFVSR